MAEPKVRVLVPPNVPFSAMMSPTILGDVVTVPPSSALESQLSNRQVASHLKAAGSRELTGSPKTGNGDRGPFEARFPAS